MYSLLKRMIYGEFGDLSYTNLRLVDESGSLSVELLRR